MSRSPICEIQSKLKMAASISDEDFLLLQGQLIELKASNYTLEERCRKQCNEISTLQQRWEGLHNEFQKAQKTISKSKKVKEVELLLQENEALQQKLQCQEDEFRLQNTTIMEELSTVLSSNETMEKEIKTLRMNQTQDLQLGINGDVQNQIRRLQAENSALQKNVTEANQSCEKEIIKLRKVLLEIMRDSESECKTPDGDIGDNSEVNSALHQDEKNDYELVEVGDHEVSYKKSPGKTLTPFIEKIETNLKKLENQLKESSGLQVHLDTEREEKRLLQQQYDDLQKSSHEETGKLKAETDKLSDKLRKKQESLVQLQAEKEKMYSENKKTLEDTQAAKDAEINQLKELTHRLQVQLNNLLQNSQEQKDHSAFRIQELESKVTGLRSEIDSQALDKLKELEADRIVLQSQISDAKANLHTMQQENASLKVQVETTNKNADLLASQINALQAENEALSENADSLRKTCEKRKALLDEMAIRFQTKTDDHQREIMQLTEKYAQQVETITRQLEEEKLKAAELEVLRSKNDDMETEIKSLECTRGWFERRLTEAEESLESTRKHYDAVLARLQSDHESEITTITEAHALGIKDVETQLEIANAQRSEYEESLEKLKQDIKDGLEDRKIHEKKGASIVKDLKRQLKSERKRAENLQERLQEFLNESNQSRNADLFKTTDADKAETSSISSWSMMSGGACQPDSKDTKEDGNLSLSNGGSPTPSNILEQDNEVLMQKVANLQKEKWVLEERLNHLEQSSSAMAEDIVRKTAVIQYYCMEGRSEPHPHAVVDKFTVKRVVDFIKDKGDENLKEINRKMQRMLEETLTKNMHLQKDLEAMSQEVVRLSKIPASSVSTA